MAKSSLQGCRLFPRSNGGNSFCENPDGIVLRKSHVYFLCDYIEAILALFLYFTRASLPASTSTCFALSPRMTLS